MLKRARGKGPTKGIQGFVIELPTAGGHNAPPRGFRCRLPPRRRQAPRRLRCGRHPRLSRTCGGRYDAVAKSHSVDLNEKGEPVYGPKDEVNLPARSSRARRCRMPGRPFRTWRPSTWRPPPQRSDRPLHEASAPSTCQVNLLKFLKATKGLPFYLAGSYAQPEKFNDVLDIGGVGVQVGSVGSI